jgi:predicted dehydrogenase
MKVLIVGFGSIGQRHAAVLNELGCDVAIVSRRPIDFPQRYDAIKTAVDEFLPDYTVIASSTNEHRHDINILSDAGFTGMLLIEKPLYDHGSEQISDTFSCAKVGFNLRFHPALQYFREALRGLKIYTVTAYVGSYLPGWRPGTNYSHGYSAHKSRGGGVLRDLSHELDALIWMFGDWQRITAIGGHFSNLEIDSDDVFSVLFDTKFVPGISLNMNYLDTLTRREITALTDHGTVHVDLVAGTVRTTQEQKTFPVERDDTYRAQHLAMLNNDHSYLCDASEGLKVMRMIDAIEEASLKEIWVRT